MEPPLFVEITDFGLRITEFRIAQRVKTRFLTQASLDRSGLKNCLNDTKDNDSTDLWDNEANESPLFEWRHQVIPIRNAPWQLYLYHS